jgi:hypothetical protein
MTALPTLTPSTHQFRLSLTEQLQWYTPVTSGGNYDIVIVQDYSYSNRTCYVGTRVPPVRQNISCGTLAALTFQKPSGGILNPR